MARYEVKPGEARTPCGIRLGNDERRLIEAAASKDGASFSAWLRERAIEAARRELEDEAYSAREKAIEKARKAGLSEEDIKALGARGGGG